MKKPLTNKAGKVRELEGPDFQAAVSFSQLPDSLQEKLSAIRNNAGRPPSPEPKGMMAFRFSQDVLQAIRASGKGYSGRVETILREAIAEGRI